MPIQKFTVNSLKGLKAPAVGQVDVWDGLMPGFGIRVSQGGRKSFFVGTRINGKYRRITIKPPYQDCAGGEVILSLADARSRARRIIADAQGGIAPEIRKKREEKGTFGAVATDFMRDYAHSHRTRKEMQRKIDVDLKSWHDIQIADITRGDINLEQLTAELPPPEAAPQVEAPAVPIEAVPGGLAAGFSALCPDRNRSSLLTTKPFALAECWRRYAIVDAILL